MLLTRSLTSEVWLVQPHPAFVEVFVLEGGVYQLAGSYERRDALVCATFPDMSIDLRDVFDFPIDPSDEIELVKEGHPVYGSPSPESN